MNLKKYLKSAFFEVERNWKSGLAIAVVSIPLSLSFAIASGASPIMGLITSAWAGIVAAIVGGSNFNVISPAGAFAGIMTAVALQFGMGAIPVITMIAGAIMLLGYFFNAQRFLKFIPGGAIFGFTLGIAAIIAGTQINAALGLTGLDQHESILFNIIESFRNIGSLDIPTTIVFLVFLFLLFVLKKYITRIPSIILVTPLGILLGWLVSHDLLGFSILTLADQYGNLGSQLINIPKLTFAWGYIVPAVTIAVVGILETMLSAKVADRVTGQRHNERREMLGLSLANIVSGLFGGMPATGVLGPTMLNINSGAKSRTSAMLKAIFLGLITLLLFNVFTFIPMPVIAAILFFVAISMVESKRFLLYYQHDRFSLGVAVLVAGITVYKDPALGILVGSVLGLLFFAEKFSRGLYEATHNSRTSTDKEYIAGEKQFSTSAHYDILVYSFKGVLSHLNSDAHVERLEKVGPATTHVILRVREISYIDIDGVHTLDTIVDILQSKDIQVIITGIHAYIENKMKKHSRHYELLSEKDLVFPKTRHALESLGVPLPVNNN